MHRNLILDCYTYHDTRPRKFVSQIESEVKCLECKKKDYLHLLNSFASLFL